MKVSKRQLRRIIREAMVTAGTPFSRSPDTEMAQVDYAAGMLDAKRGRRMPPDASDDYAAGYEDGVAASEYATAEKRYVREVKGDQLPYSMGGPWVDKDAPVGSGAREYGDLDRELTDEEIEASMGWEQTAGDDAEYNRGYQDGLDGFPVADNATTDYDAGYEDGENDATLGRDTEPGEEDELAYAAGRPWEHN